MSTPQPGIFAFGTRSHHFLEYDVREGAEPDAVLDALRALREPPVTSGGANIVIALGPDLCRSLAPDDTPMSFRAFEAIEGVDGHGAPASQHDVWLWVHGATDDTVVDIGRAATTALAPAADLAHEQPGFVYQDSRDFTGFIDGTENPPVWEAYQAACVPKGERGEGGSFVLTMRWVHDLGRFHALPEREQELVIGRTKPDSVEIDDAERPATSHVSRAVIEGDEGEELEIFRRSVPFGSAREQGLSFVGFSCEPERMNEMLRRMFGISGDGIHDSLIEFSTPTRGAMYFAPSLEAFHGIFAGLR